MESTDELLPHLFRTEYRKVVSVLCRYFGLDQMEIAEDIASDTFALAAQTWAMEGPPNNPAAWLYHVAKNKTRSWLQRENLFRAKISPEVKHLSDEALPPPEPDLSPQGIDDSQLQMMFAICHPAIPPEAQIGLSLRILCGFGIEEIADAFLSNKETINKRLFRAREKLRQEKISIGLPPPAEIGERLDAVLITIYLLFSEGYYSESNNAVLRKDFCLEAIRLCHMLTHNPSTDQPRVNALLALMCLHASRFDARVSQTGEMILYDDQDTERWNTELIGQGAWYLGRAASGPTLSKYHLEAMIAWWNTQKTQEKWENILQLYNQLLQLEYSPIAALNRTYALARARGKHPAITEAEKLKLTNNPYYFALLGDLYTSIDDEKAVRHFRDAMELAKTTTDKQLMQRKINNLCQR